MLCHGHFNKGWLCQPDNIQIPAILLIGINVLYVHVGSLSSVQDLLISLKLMTLSALAVIAKLMHVC